MQRFGFPLTTVVSRKANFAKSASCALLTFKIFAACVALKMTVNGRFRQTSDVATQVQRIHTFRPFSR